MLEELIGFSSFGSIRGMSSIIEIVSSGRVRISDLNILSRLNGSVEIPRVLAALGLLEELGLCKRMDGYVEPTERCRQIADNPEQIGRDVGTLLLSCLIEEGAIPSSVIFFDTQKGRYCMKRTSVKMRFAAFRNLLLDAGILSAEGDLFYFLVDDNVFLQNAVRNWRQGMTPEQLMRKLKKEKEAGEIAEKYVMDYECSRLGFPKAEKVEHVSLVSVSAGFDIASFNNPQSIVFDRLIEVKAYGSRGFYLSSGELNAARKYGNNYYLYIVNINEIAEPNYSPTIICNPIEYFSSCDDWRITPDRLRIAKLDSLN